MRFARPFLDWSPDIKQAYFDSLAAVEQEAAALGDAARTDPLGHLPQLVAIHRGLTIRSALYWENRGHRILKPLRPVFDEGVALACRLADLAGAGQGREALGRALTDRSMFLVAAKQYGEAYDDFLEAIALPD